MYKRTEEHRKQVSERMKERLRLQREDWEKNGKPCPKCEKRKPLSAYLKTKRGYESRCQVCTAEDYRAWRKTPAGKASEKRRAERTRAKPETAKQRKAYREKKRSEWASVFIELNLHRCAACGYDKNFAAIELHHVDPSEKDKTIKIGTAMTRRINQKVIDELKKCIALCATCHREHHHPEVKSIADYV